MNEMGDGTRRTGEVCTMLRTKTAFGTLVSDSLEAAPWQSGASTTAVYWCLRTMQSAGPDDGFAHPHACCEGRNCFERQQD